MTRYIGLDVHQHSTTAVVMGPTGKHVRSLVLETQAEPLRDFVRGISRPRHLCFEEGTQSEWLYEVLEPNVDELVVVKPAKRDGIKSDEADARRLADGLRRGSLDGVVFKPAGQFTALRQAVRGHEAVLKDLVRAKHRLRAVCRSRGLAASNDLWSAERRASCLQALPEHHRRLAEMLGDELDQLAETHVAAEAWLRGEGSRLPIVRRLTTVPGLGPIRAAQVVSVVVTPWRFRTKRQFWSYCGLAVVTRSSGDWRRDSGGQWVRHQSPQPRGLNRNRHPVLKAVFKGAAMTVITSRANHPLHHAYLQTLQNTKPHLARLTLARRIAAATLAVWKKQEDYDPTKQVATDPKS